MKPRNGKHLSAGPLAFGELKDEWTARARTIQAERAGLDVEADYTAGKTGRLKKQRNLLGGTADAHLRLWADYWRAREYARDADRNDAFFGQMVDRACQNILGGGLRCEPQTGDRVLDQELQSAWNEWWTEPHAIDVAGRHDGPTYEFIALRHLFIDGDFFVRRFTEGAHEGKVQWLEGDRINSPTHINDGNVHGVELGDYGQPLTYHILKQLPEQRKWRRFFVPEVSPVHYDSIPAMDADGLPAVLHIYDPQRFTQSRGMTAFRAVFDLGTMLDDTNFAQLLKAQVSSCAAVFLTRERDYQFGDRDTETVDGYTTTFEKLKPGGIFRLRPGEGMQGFNPKVPNSEYFQHVRLLLRIIGGAIGLPLSIVLLDTSETTFHGYRGELQQAYLGFRRIQSFLPRRLHGPLYRWRTARFLARERGMKEPPAKMLGVRWGTPGWPYVDPMKDAQADVLRIDNLLASPRQVAAERGKDYEAIAREAVADRALSIRVAVEEAEKLESDGITVSWQQLLAGAGGPDAPRDPMDQQEAPDDGHEEEEKAPRDADSSPEPPPVKA